jgi:hypothetical protein
MNRQTDHTYNTKMSINGHSMGRSAGARNCGFSPDMASTISLFGIKRNVITNQELIGYVVLWADGLHVAAADCPRMPEEAQIQ